MASEAKVKAWPEIVVAVWKNLAREKVQRTVQAATDQDVSPCISLLRKVVVQQSRILEGGALATAQQVTRLVNSGVEAPIAGANVTQCHVSVARHPVGWRDDHLDS